MTSITIKKTTRGEFCARFVREHHRTMNFRQWAIQARMTDTPVGDLIGDYREDGEAPDDFESLDRLRLYLHMKNACPGAIEAAAGAWKRYQGWRRKDRT